jgi:hypothetical protein
MQSGERFRLGADLCCTAGEHLHVSPFCYCWTSLGIDISLHMDLCHLTRVIIRRVSLRDAVMYISPQFHGVSIKLRLWWAAPRTGFNGWIL